MGYAVAGATVILVAVWWAMDVDVDVSSEPEGAIAPSVRQEFSRHVPEALRPEAADPVPEAQPTTGDPDSEHPPSRLSGPDPFQELLARLESLGKQGRWDPISWGPVDGLAAPAAFRSTMEGLAGDGECELGSDLLFVDCREPPCYAVFRARADEFSPKRCPRWFELFGDSVSSLRVQVPCISGDLVVYLITPIKTLDAALPAGVTREDADERKAPRFAETLDLEELCRIHEESSP